MAEEEEPLHVEARQVEADDDGLWMGFLVDEVGFRRRLLKRRMTGGQDDDEDDRGAG